MNSEIKLHLEALMRTPAYWNPNDPQHEIVKEKVSKVFGLEHEGELHGRRVSPIVFTTADPK